MDAVNALIRNIKKQQHGAIVVAADNLPETIKVNGKERPTRNSENRFIHFSLDGIKNFWKWFGESKVVDNQGKPLIVYHGTHSVFDSWAETKNTLGFHFGTKGAANARIADDNHPVNANIMPVYLKIDNYIESQDLQFWEASACAELLKANGIEVRPRTFLGSSFYDYSDIKSPHKPYQIYLIRHTGYYWVQDGLRSTPARVLITVSPTVSASPSRLKNPEGCQ